MLNVNTETKVVTHQIKEVISSSALRLSPKVLLWAHWKLCPWQLRIKFDFKCVISLFRTRFIFLSCSVGAALLVICVSVTHALSPYYSEDHLTEE